MSYFCDKRIYTISIYIGTYMIAIRSATPREVEGAHGALRLRGHGHNLSLHHVDAAPAIYSDNIIVSYKRFHFNPTSWDTCVDTCSDEDRRCRNRRARGAWTRKAATVMPSVDALGRYTLRSPPCIAHTVCSIVYIQAFRYTTRIVSASRMPIHTSYTRRLGTAAAQGPGPCRSTGRAAAARWPGAYNTSTS